MTSAQGWVLLGLIGVFASAVVTLLVYSQQNLRGYLGAKVEGVEHELGGRIDSVEQKLIDLDRDVQTLIERVFRDRP